MFDGMWTLEAVSPSPSITLTSGVVVLQGGRAYGGNGEYYFVGTYAYDEKEGRVEIVLKVSHYAGEPMPALGGRKHFVLVFSGVFHPESFVVRGRVPEAPQFELDVRMTNRLLPESRS